MTQNASKLPKSFSPIRPENPGEATYPHQLPIELALGLNPVADICSAYGLTKADFEAIIQLPQFVAQYDWAMAEKLKPGGVTRLQCAMMTDEAVKVLFFAMTDTTNSLNQRAQHAKDVIRLAGHEPVKQKEQEPDTEKFSIVINMAPAQGAPAALPAAGRTITVYRGAQDDDTD